MYKEGKLVLEISQDT